MTPLAIDAIEAALRFRGRMVGILRYSDPWRHFGAGGVEEAERACERINADLPAFMRPPSEVDPGDVAVEIDGRGGDVPNETIRFDTPIPSGIAENDRVEVRLWRSDHARCTDRVVVFHHPAFQSSWRPWRWFLAELIEHVPVAAMAAPYHYERKPPDWFPGEGMTNPNPLRMFEAIRQWHADQRALHRVLRERLDLEPCAVVGFSLGAFQALLAASIGALELPIVSIASTNRYSYGLIHGPLGRGVIEGMRRVGIDEARLCRMVDSLELERYVPAMRGHPVLFVAGVHDRVDPPPSGQRLEQALQPSRTLHVPAGHATLTMHRRLVSRAMLEFLEEVAGI